MRRYNDYKFRVWDKDNKRMQYLEFDDCGSWLDHEQYPENAPDSIMQYTGLRDKNNKKIYYGDIVKFEFFIKDDKERESITTPYREKEGYGGHAVIERTINYGVGILYDFDETDANEECYAVTEGGQIEDIWEDKNIWEIEVIGNIYENPDLIK